MEQAGNLSVSFRHVPLDHRTMSITPGLVFEYDVYLTIGTAEEMRERFKPIARKFLEKKAE